VSHINIQKGMKGSTWLYAGAHRHASYPGCYFWRGSCEKSAWRSKHFTTYEQILLTLMSVPSVPTIFCCRIISFVGKKVLVISLIHLKTIWNL